MGPATGSRRSGRRRGMPSPTSPDGTTACGVAAGAPISTAASTMRNAPRSATRRTSSGSSNRTGPTRRWCSTATSRLRGASSELANQLLADLKDVDLLEIPRTQPVATIHHGRRVQRGSAGSHGHSPLVSNPPPPARHSTETYRGRVGQRWSLRWSLTVGEDRSASHRSW